MKKQTITLGAACLLAFLATSCGQKKEATQPPTTATTEEGKIELPAPYATESTKLYSDVIGWKDGQMPTAPAGFTVTEFARDLKNPRWIYVTPNGDILVVESQSERKGVKKVEAVASGQAKSEASGKSANRITLFRDTNKDGKPDVRETFLEGLNQPLGMLVIGNNFYVANTNAVLKFPYQAGQTKIMGQGTKIMNLPAGGYNNHWTRNLLANADNSKIYVTVGSGTNIAEHGMDNEKMRANILEINPDGTGERVFASGLRNPVGMSWQPGTKTLWAAVNERDELGDNLVPDYITSVKEGAFYGWPYSYYGPNEDPRRKGERPDLVKKAIVPDVPMGAHTASLGLTFYDKKAFPAKYQNGAFVGQRGSWNRSKFSGYRVAFVPFKDGKPSGKPEDFLTGFIINDKEVHGRPVGVTVLPDGAMLVADDAGNRVWHVSAK